MYQPTAPLTFANASSVLADGLRAIDSGQSVIDLAGVSTIDSSAVAVLLAWQRA
ncbi:MAG: STAS domain-containing protein, partial [Pseudomonadota bacterium]|nr:STAS domain-containing protein [Pseudomonadota bacterium]